ncbi:heme-binding protein [halophilic archaeon]|nr:heme-binding protein [halophilic archaeon]
MQRPDVKSALARSLGAAALLGSAWVGWGLYVRTTTETVSYDTVVTLDGVEVRRYPETVVATTTAGSPNEAFGRLFRYIEGENRADEEIAMTAPVATRPDAVLTRPESVPVTAPVATESADGETEMAFFLPTEYAVESAPAPTDPEVRVERLPERTLAVLPFSWYATDERVDRLERRLLGALDDHGVPAVGDTFLMRYDPPLTPPFMRRNEVAVEVAPT